MAGARRSIWLVGLSGSGKSTVGPLVARRLGYDFVDLDELVERSEGRTVAEIFEDDGESAFRDAEARASDSLLGRDRIVVATGGGWMARDDIARGPDGCVRVWLRVSPVAAFARLGAGGHGRPLLSGRDGEAALSALLGAREARYGEAEIAVQTTGRTPQDVARAVVDAVGGLVDP
ncbi:MAG: shikimate kinase [Gemmatimonadota bacterium]|nr:shikimate kinase [Gemmatimonadota bacterium]